MEIRAFTDKDSEGVIDLRRRTGLMTAARELLLDRGCPKINLQVRAGNREAREFYESLGYSEDSVTSFGLRLIPDR
jgi:GNAT superfamily N-acetyltransferase